MVAQQWSRPDANSEVALVEGVPVTRRDILVRKVEMQMPALLKGNAPPKVSNADAFAGVEVNVALYAYGRQNGIIISESEAENVAKNSLESFNSLAIGNGKRGFEEYFSGLNITHLTFI